MSVTPTELRRNLYTLLDKVIETGEPLEVRRGEQKVWLVAQPGNGKKLDQLMERDCIDGEPEDLVDLDPLNLKDEDEGGRRDLP